MAGRFFGIPFATTGDRTPVPDAAQPDGSVSMAQGFTSDYELPNTDPNYKPVPREETNALYHDITEAIGIMQAQGYADWTIDATPYTINSFVRHSDRVWRNTVANNSAEPGTAGSNWVDELAQDSGMIVFSTAGVTSWTVPQSMQLGLIKPKITVIGGGGGGGAAISSADYNAAGGGGGAGGASISIVDLTGVATVSITVGAGGAAGVAGGSSATSGGSSSFGSYFSATGGVGGNSATATSLASQIGAGGHGGLGTGGSINAHGGGGTGGIIAAWGVAGSSAGRGRGGSSFYSGGADSAVVFGAGGNGAGTTGGNQSVNGVAGGAGAVVIEW